MRTNDSTKYGCKPFILLTHLSLQHVVFASSHPYRYWPGSSLPNFSEITRMSISTLYGRKPPRLMDTKCQVGHYPYVTNYTFIKKTWKVYEFSKINTLKIFSSPMRKYRKFGGHSLIHPSLTVTRKKLGELELSCTIYIQMSIFFGCCLAFFRYLSLRILNQTLYYSILREHCSHSALHA